MLEGGNVRNFTSITSDFTFYQTFIAKANIDLVKEVASYFSGK